VSGRFPSIEITVSVGTWSEGHLALCDTGCSSGVIVPAQAVEAIDAPFEYERFALGDTRVVDVPTWDGSVEIEGRTFETRVSAIGDEFLVGMGVLSQLQITLSFGSEVRLRFRDG
jgi:predicted aspartyl protease